MFTANQFVAHLVGDYCLQSHWMATEKTKSSLAAAVHAFFYTLPFLLLTHDIEALALIAISHFVIDRWRLARYVIWLKNWLGPVYVTREAPPPGVNVGFVEVWHSRTNRAWSECSKTGYPDDMPSWLAVWLLIITDNTLHILCNGLALHYFV